MSRDHCGCRSSDSCSPRRHWCFWKPSEAWVRGCVQICDDACSSSGDLDWEFALQSCPGHWAGMEVHMRSRVIEAVINHLGIMTAVPKE